MEFFTSRDIQDFRNFFFLISFNAPYDFCLLCFVGLNGNVG